MKPYAANPSEAHMTKWCRKRKRVAARVKAERVYRKTARRAGKVPPSAENDSESV